MYPQQCRAQRPELFVASAMCGVVYSCPSVSIQRAKHEYKQGSCVTFLVCITLVRFTIHSLRQVPTVVVLFGQCVTCGLSLQGLAWHRGKHMRPDHFRGSDRHWCQWILPFATETRDTLSETLCLSIAFQLLRIRVEGPVASCETYLNCNFVGASDEVWKLRGAIGFATVRIMAAVVKILFSIDSNVPQDRWIKSWIFLINQSEHTGLVNTSVVSVCA